MDQLAGGAGWAEELSPPYLLCRKMPADLAACTVARPIWRRDGMDPRVCEPHTNVFPGGLSSKWSGTGAFLLACHGFDDLIRTPACVATTKWSRS